MKGSAPRAAAIRSSRVVQLAVILSLEHALDGPRRLQLVETLRSTAGSMWEAALLPQVVVVEQLALIGDKDDQRALARERIHIGQRRSPVLFLLPLVVAPDETYRLQAAYQHRACQPIGPGR